MAFQLEKIQREFLWKGCGTDQGLHLIFWDRVCSPKAIEGLGLRRTEVMNKALLCKWLWRFGREDNSFWRKVVVSRHGTLPNGDPYPRDSLMVFSPFLLEG